MKNWSSHEWQKRQTFCETSLVTYEDKEEVRLSWTVSLLTWQSAFSHQSRAIPSRNVSIFKLVVGTQGFCPHQISFPLVCKGTAQLQFVRDICGWGHSVRHSSSVYKMSKQGLEAEMCGSDCLNNQTVHTDTRYHPRVTLSWLKCWRENRGRDVVHCAVYFTHRVLSSLQNLTDEAVHSISESNSDLETLCVSGCTHLTDASLVSLGKWTLPWFWASRCEAERPVWVTLPGIKSLTNHHTPPSA